jgi:hypothetical protein
MASKYEEAQCSIYFKSVTMLVISMTVIRISKLSHTSKSEKESNLCKNVKMSLTNMFENGPIMESSRICKRKCTVFLGLTSIRLVEEAQLLKIATTQTVKINKLCDYRLLNITCLRPCYRLADLYGRTKSENLTGAKFSYNVN